MMQTVWERSIRWMAPSMALILLVGCTSATYNDPVNPKQPYMFPGQGPTASGLVTTEPTAPPAMATPAPVPTAVTPAPAIPVTTPAPPVTPNTVTSQPIAVQPVEAQPAPAVPMPAPPITAPAIPVTPVTPGTPAVGSADAQTVFRPGDNMIVSFSDIPAPGLQSINIELGPDGKITLHHNVQVYALGKTARGLEQEIRSEYVPKFYKYLTVTIKTEMRFFHVNGEVKQPAMYTWRGEMTVLRAIGQAGGFTDWSKKNKVQLTRSNGQKFTVDCVKAQADPSKDLPVYPGDYINVPKKGPLW